MEEAKRKTEEERLKNENATFKPQTNKRKPKDELNHFNIGQGSAGMQKYLMRQEQARLNKVEKQIHEAKVFRQGDSWKPTQTVPKTPKISQGFQKGSFGNPQVKALEKPSRSIVAKSDLKDYLFDSNDMMCTQYANRIVTNQSIKRPPPAANQYQQSASSSYKHAFYQTLTKQQSLDDEDDSGLKITSDMSYEQCKRVLHQ